jgi:hypothetical protein
MALGGQSQTWFFSSFFAPTPRKKKKKGYFGGDCIPQTPALQSGKPLKLTHMPQDPPTEGMQSTRKRFFSAVLAAKLPEQH